MANAGTSALPTAPDSTFSRCGPLSFCPGEAGTVIAPVWAKERTRKGIPSIISVRPLQTRPVALLGQRLRFGAWCGSGPGTVLQGAVSQGTDYCGIPRAVVHITICCLGLVLVARDFMGSHGCPLPWANPFTWFVRRCLSQPSPPLFYLPGSLGPPHFLIPCPVLFPLLLTFRPPTLRRWVSCCETSYLPW